VYEREAGRLYRHLLASTRNSEAAEDLTAEVFVRLAWKGPRFPHDGAIRRWLDVTADRLVVDWRRARAREILRAKAPDVPDSGAAPDVVAALVVKEAVSRLPPAQATIIRWHFGHDLPLTTVAERLGITPEAARSRLYCALRTLRAVLAEEPVTPNGGEERGR
jgi:RNA polymerase sigma-70 factor (ECF subfamily)